MCLNLSLTMSFRTHGTNYSCTNNWSTYVFFRTARCLLGWVHSFHMATDPSSNLLTYKCMLIQHFTLHAFWWTLQPHIQLRHKSFVIITTIALTTSNGITNICIFISTGSSGSLEPTLTSNAFHSYVWKTLPCHLISLLHLRTLLSLLLNTCYIMPSILCLKIFFMQ